MSAGNFNNVLSLNADKALVFFMNSARYCGFELPEYFEFNPLLRQVQKLIGDTPFKDCCSADPVEMDKVNLNILLNKDGKYGVRPLTLLNPFLYYFLCREVCNKKAWQAIRKCFETFDVPHIKSSAMPVIPSDKESFHKSSIILNWWNSMEQRSLELSLEYRYMFVTDITNCYGSINPQSIDWALSMKGTAHENGDNHELAQNIIKYIQCMQHGQNIGIPQGSEILNLVGEIILGYSDLLLHEAVEREKAKGNDLGDFEILRYRDDYRVFCNNRDSLEQLSYLLQQVLESLNFRMNTSKTHVSNSLVLDSIKPDKLAYIYNTPIFNKKGCDFDGIQKHFLYILMFAHEHPNAGQLKVMLTDLDNRVKERLEPQSYKDSKGVEKIYKGHIKENKRAIIAIAIQLAVDNVSVVNYVLRIVSRILDDIADVKERKEIIDLVFKRLRHQPNSTYTQVWLQNITYQLDKKSKVNPYDLALCRLVMGEYVELWNNTWLKDKYSHLSLKSIINKKLLKKAAPVITFRETRAYEELDY